MFLYGRAVSFLEKTIPGAMLGASITNAKENIK